MRAAGTILTLLLAAACDGPGYQIDRFPIAVDMDGGVPVAFVRLGDGGPIPVWVDTGSAFTAIRADGGDVTPRRFTLTVDGITGDGPTPRARFGSVLAFLGQFAGMGVLGGDVLEHVAVRFDLPHSRLFFFPDITADADVLAQACHPVINTHIAGGGTYQLSGGTYDLSSTRVIVPACPDPDDTKQKDMRLLVATGMGPLVLSSSSYARITGVNVDDVAKDPRLTDGQIQFPGQGSPTSARIGVLKLGDLELGLVLVSDESDKRGACCELCASRKAEEGQPDTTCGCPKVTPPPASAAFVRLEPPVPVAVIPDDDRVLQGLREELRPELADIDGLVGSSLLGRITFDLDYPNGRMIFRCPPGPDCRPRVADQATRATLAEAGCFVTPPDAAPLDAAPPDAI